MIDETRRIQTWPTLDENCDIIEANYAQTWDAISLTRRKFESLSHAWPCLRFTIRQIMSSIRVELLLNKQKDDRLNKAFKDKITSHHWRLWASTTNAPKDHIP